MIVDAQPRCRAHMRSANRRSDSSSTIPSRDREHRPAHHTGAAKNLEYTATPHGHRDDDGGSTGLETAPDVTCLRGAPTPPAVPGHRTSFRAVVAAGCGEWLLREVSRVAQLPRPASEHVRSLHNSPPALRDSHCSRSRPDLDAACRDQRIFDVHPLVFCRPDCGRHRPGVRTCASFRAAQPIHTPQVRELLGGQLDHCTLRLPNSCASDTA